MRSGRVMPRRGVVVDGTRAMFDCMMCRCVVLAAMRRCVLRSGGGALRMTGAVLALVRCADLGARCGRNGMAGVVPAA